ncbi:MAG: hypothetical protein RMM29_00905 [Planctomycetota bacterium]|nr:hypothetical protein [Planctomycetota bacterium]MCX8039084.1 hypothetical protein [Planctomycetota bacterium]MDW8372194.1 hypothetical protein [Planctomycetota bacterium]
MDALLRYIALTEEIRRLEAEREALRAHAVRQLKQAGGRLDDGQIRAVYVSKPVYRFTPVVEEIRLQLAKRQRREIERGLAERCHDTEVVHIERAGETGR